MNIKTRTENEFAKKTVETPYSSRAINNTLYLPNRPGGDCKRKEVKNHWSRQFK
jgi:hypothetical protein